MLLGLNSRRIARFRKWMPENTDKTVRIELEIGGKWRFFGGLERHFVATTRAAMSSVTPYPA